MVKQLLFFAAAALCAPAFAQHESAFVDAEASVGSLAAGAELCKSGNVTMKVAFADTYKATSLTADGNVVKAVSIDGVTYNLTTKGIAGNANPKTVDCKQLPSSGAVFQFDVKASGYLYVFAKLSGSKQIYVSNEPEAYVVAYTVSAFDAAGNNFTYTLPVNEEAGPDVFKTLDAESTFTDAQNAYVASTKLATPDACFKAANAGTTLSWSDSASGCVAFPVKANTNYYFYCAGSKVTCNGFAFIPGASEVAKIEAAEEKDPSAIKNITMDDLDADAPVYNLQGQRVSKNYKGVCIQNGKKFVVK